MVLFLVFPSLNVEVNSPFKNPAPFKTSSPIESDESLGSIERDDMGRMSSIPFRLEEEEVPERVLQKTTDV